MDTLPYELVNIILSFLPTPQDYIRARLSGRVLGGMLTLQDKTNIKGEFLTRVERRQHRNRGFFNSIYFVLPNGLKEGPFEEWMEDDDPTQVFVPILGKSGDYRNGQRHGIWEYFHLHLNGKLMGYCKGRFKKGERVGVWICEMYNLLGTETFFPDYSYPSSEYDRCERCHPSYYWED